MKNSNYNKLEYDYEELIPELKEWNKCRGIDVNSYITSIRNINHFIGYASILYPQFFTFKECIFLNKVNEDTYNYYFQLKKNISHVEKMLNHRHIVDYFKSENNININQLIFVGEILKETWFIKLKQDFPDKRFIVEFKEGDLNNLTGYYVTFYQER